MMEEQSHLSITLRELVKIILYFNKEFQVSVINYATYISCNYLKNNNIFLILNLLLYSSLFVLVISLAISQLAFY